MGDTQTPSLSIVIATKEGRHLRRCLRSLQRLPGHTSLEVLVVVDAAEEPPCLKDYRIIFPEFQFHLSPLGGVSNARNKGLRLSTGKYILFLDDDCLIEDAGFIPRLMNLADEEGYIHGGSYALSGKPRYWSRIYQAVNHLWLRSGKSEKGQIHLLGGFIFARSEVKPFIHFPPELKWGGEEKEMLRHLERHSPYTGKWHSDFTLTHLDESDFSAFARRAYRQGVAAGKFDLSGPFTVRFRDLQWDLVPGLALFFVLSRFGIVLGKWEKICSKANLSERRLPLSHTPGEKES